MENLAWRKINGEKIISINDYVLNYVKNVDKGSKVIIGCDSDSHMHRTKYAVSVVFYNEEKRKGAHVVYATYTEPKVKDLVTKLWNEALLSHDVAESINETLSNNNYKYKFDKNYYDDSTPNKLVEIHVDLNVKKNTRNGARLSNNKSNKVYNDVMGWLCGEKYKVMGKPYSFASSSASDRLCK